MHGLGLKLSLILGMALFSIGSACIEPPPGPDPDALPVGALLPFTGDIATSGTNIERALLMVAEQVNQAGGIGGQAVRIAARDTHSDLRRGIDAAKSLVFDEHVQAIIGPQNEELALQMLPIIREAATVQVSGGVISPTFSTINDAGLWFRTCPSALVHASALARRMYLDGVRRAAVIYIGDEYGSGFAATLINEFVHLGISAPAPVSFQPGQASYTSALRPVEDFDPEAIVLVAYPKTGATIIQQWSLLVGKSRWYLSPTLKAKVFIDNVPPGLLDGSVGVAASLAGDAAEFADEFARRWEGEQPLDAAYFYYDAAALVFLAMAAVAQEGQNPSGPLIAAKLVEIAGPDGEPVAWDQLDQGLELIGNGEPIDYRGASGPVDLDPAGDLTIGQVELWTIEDDQIVPLAGN